MARIINHKESIFAHLFTVSINIGKVLTNYVLHATDNVFFLDHTSHTRISDFNLDRACTR